jgi:hypothetical protein
MTVCRQTCGAVGSDRSQFDRCSGPIPNPNTVANAADSPIALGPRARHVASIRSNAKQALMITVHHLDDSRSPRVLWLLEELGVPYEVKHYARDARSMLAPPALRAVHPLGKSPVITDDDVTAAESGAISEYLVERHGGGKLRPGSNTPARLRYTYRLHFAERSAMPPLLLSLIFSRSPKQPMAFFAKPIARAIGTNVKKLRMSIRTSTGKWTSWSPSSRSDRGLPARIFRPPTFR